MLPQENAALMHYHGVLQKESIQLLALVMAQVPKKSVNKVMLHSAALLHLV
jgi:hypothetical protein